MGRQLAQAVRHLQAHRLTTRTRFGGHGGSEAMPQEKIERDPWLKRMFLGYAFSIDYRDRRGHAYMLADQEKTERLTKPQSGSCLHCHASIMPLYRKLGDGDAMKGFEASHKLSYQEANKSSTIWATPTPCPASTATIPKSMKLRVTRPGFMLGIQALAASDARCRTCPPSNVARRRPPDALRPQHGPSQTRCAPSSAAVPRGVLLRPQDAPDVPLGQGPAAENLEEHWNSTKFPTASASSTTNTPRPARRSSRPSTRSSSCGARACTPAAGSPAPTATCPTCATAPPRSPTTGCAARC
jgi:nitrite reductase (cytochrome c-552)